MYKNICEVPEYLVDVYHHEKVIDYDFVEHQGCNDQYNMQIHYINLNNDKKRKEKSWQNRVHNV